MCFSTATGVFLLALANANATAFTTHSIAAGCVADLNGVFPEPDPLFLRPGVTYDDVLDYEEAFLLPSDTDGLLHLQTGDTVRIACPGSSLSLTGKAEDVATCNGNNQFKIQNYTVTIEELACKATVTNTAVRKDACSGGTGVELGFKLETMFPLIYTCFDEDLLLTRWSLERVSAELKGSETGEASPSFKKDDFYPNLDVDKLYTYANQVTAFTQLLGSSDLATQYLKDQSSYYLARGHFAPRADFVFGAHTRATFHFINVAPQWQIFNEGVWYNLELAVRDYVISTQTALTTYTGPWDILKYPDTKGKLVPLYLANPGTASQTLQVPKFYWKLLIEPDTQRGVVFVGINDPSVAIPYPDDYQLCPDVLAQISWISFKNTKWLYACHVEDFVRLSDTFPQVHVNGLLDNKTATYA